MTIATRALGKTGTDVTILGYGAMELRGQPRGPAIDDEDAGRLLNAVLDGGINLIDTSIDYGRSEELIGRYVGHRRDPYHSPRPTRNCQSSPKNHKCRSRYAQNPKEPARVAKWKIFGARAAMLTSYARASQSLLTKRRNLFVARLATWDRPPS